MMNIYNEFHVFGLPINLTILAELHNSYSDE
jgi:hypothetical protein